MQLSPFWQEDHQRPENLLASKEIPEKAGVAIIGSGYTGLSTARRLIKSGASVGVLERETIGWGVSSRNSGITGCGLKAVAQTIFKRFRENCDHLFWQALIDAIDLVKELVEGDGIHYALGYGGHDLHTAFYLGREISHVLSDEKASNPFMEIHHQSFFFYRNKTWFMPYAAYLYRVKDWLSQHILILLL